MLKKAENDEKTLHSVKPKYDSFAESRKRYDSALKNCKNAEINRKSAEENLKLKQNVFAEKKSLEGKIERVLTNAGYWIEPMQKWIETAVSICSIDEKTEHSEIARAFRKIEGLNLKMKNKKVVAERDAKSHSPQKNSWLALRAAREKTAPEGGNFRSFPKMVQFYTFARTQFQRNCE